MPDAGAVMRSDLTANPSLFPTERSRPLPSYAATCRRPVVSGQPTTGARQDAEVAEILAPTLLQRAVPLTAKRS